MQHSNKIAKLQKDLEHSHGNSDINIVTELDNAKTTNDINFRNKTQRYNNQIKSRIHRRGRKKNTKYFANLEKKADQKIIKKLETINGALTNSDDILDYTRKYFSELYSCDQTIIIDDNFFNYGHNKLNDNEIEILLGHISKTKCEETIRNMNNNQCPGSDGISVEFYKLFQKDIKELYKLDKLLVYNWPFNRTTNFKYNNIDTQKGYRYQ